MAVSGKSPAQVLELPEGASLQQIEAAYARGLELLDAQSMAGYGMFDAESSARLRDELHVAYRALMADTAAAAAPEPPPPAVAPPSPHELAARAPLPPPPAAAAQPVAPAVPSAPEEAPRSAPPPAAQAASDAQPQAASDADAPVQAPPPRAVPSMALGQDGLRVRLCAPRTDPLAEPLTGAVLKQLRESLGANVDDVCEVTKINRRYIVALEEEDFSLLPATVYVRGFVGEYARVLGLQVQATAPYVEAYARWCSSHS